MHFLCGWYSMREEEKLCCLDFAHLFQIFLRFELPAVAVQIQLSLWHVKAGGILALDEVHLVVYLA